MDSIKSGKKNIIQGVVTPREWDQNDEVVSVSIETSDEKSFWVMENDMGLELMNFINDGVEAVGVTEEDGEGNLYFTVHDFALVDYSDDFDWDELEE